MRSFPAIREMLSSSVDTSLVAGFNADDDGGAFTWKWKRGPRSTVLRVIVGNGAGWDHVSVSRASAVPTWEMMEDVKRAVFRSDETAMQLHVPPSQHINCHPYCLHLWRPHDAAIPMPPAWMVGPPARANVDEVQG